MMAAEEVIEKRLDEPVTPGETNCPIIDTKRARGLSGVSSDKDESEAMPSPKRIKMPHPPHSDTTMDDEAQHTEVSKQNRDILYSVRTVETNYSDRWFYSATKFEGWRDPHEIDNAFISEIEIWRDIDCLTPENVVTRKKTMKKKDYHVTNYHIDLLKDVEIKQQRQPAMRIHSQVIISVLRHVIKYDPDHTLAGKSLFFHWPWHFLVRYRDDLVKFKEDLGRTRTIPEEMRQNKVEVEVDEIQRLTQLLLDTINPEYEKIVEELELHRESRCAKFENLWLLFRPGDYAYIKVDDELTASIIVRIEGKKEEKEKEVQKWKILVWNFRYVGGQIRRHMSEVTISIFPGQRQISSLKVFPCKYHDDADGNALQNKLIERGRRFSLLIREPFAHRDYDGMTLGAQPRQLKGQIIIDPVSYASQINRRRPGYDRMSDIYTKHGNFDFDPWIASEVAEPSDFGGGDMWQEFDGFDPKDHTMTEKLDDKHFILFPRSIRGMSLKDKEWEIYDMDRLKEIKWEDPKDKILDRLLIDKKSRKIIKSTRRSKVSRDNSENLHADWQDGKGAGQVFLFHGAPGTGKTMAVECIAKYTRQPVISLSNADLAIAGDTEKKLEHWFGLAQAWDAHVLIDEAEVFMEQRGKDSLKRNAMVSVFLRTIEYFEGMLFLTTNRMGVIDSAIRSRIQVSLEFPEFNRSKREDLWRMFFAKFESDGLGLINNDTKDEFFGSTKLDVEMNGRDIRNALQHAINEARFGTTRNLENPGPFELKRSHLESAMEMRERLMKIHAQANDARDEGEMAQLNHERAPRRSNTD